MDGLIRNAGTRFQRTFADEPLLERLRLMPRDEMVDPDVRKKCNQLYRQWAMEYRNTAGLEQIATLYKQLPQTKRHQPKPSQSKVVRETEAEARRDNSSSPPLSPTTPVKSSSTGSSSTPSVGWVPQLPPVQLNSTSSSSSFFKRDKKNKSKPFNLEKEKHELLETIAQAQLASTNLINGLKLINREDQRVSDNAECRKRFEACKVLRRRILRYIQFVESEQYIGSLLTANDEIVKALMTYEVMDKSIDDDSDSDPEYEATKAAFQRRTSGQLDVNEAFAGISLNAAANAAPSKPPRPGGLVSPPVVTPSAASVGKHRVIESESEPEDDEDEDDPFADRNAVKSPHGDKDGLTW